MRFMRGLWGRCPDHLPDLAFGRVRSFVLVRCVLLSVHRMHPLWLQVWHK